MGIPMANLPYLANYVAFQKLLKVDGKRYNLYEMDHVTGDGKDVPAGPLYQHFEQQWSHHEYGKSLFRPASDNFKQVQPPFLKFNKHSRDPVQQGLNELEEIPEDSIYGQYLSSERDPSPFTEEPRPLEASKPPSWFQRLKDRIKRFMAKLRSKFKKE